MEEDGGLETLPGLVRVSVLADIDCDKGLNAGVESWGNLLRRIAAHNKAVEESMNVSLDSSLVACESKDREDHTSDKSRKYARGGGGSRGHVKVKVESLFEEAVCKVPFSMQMVRSKKLHLSLGDSKSQRRRPHLSMSAFIRL
jgi:hypothetical protein